ARRAQGRAGAVRLPADLVPALRRGATGGRAAGQAAARRRPRLRRRSAGQAHRRACGAVGARVRRAHCELPLRGRALAVAARGRLSTVAGEYNGFNFWVYDVSLSILLAEMATAAEEIGPVDAGGSAVPAADPCRGRS